MAKAAGAIIGGTVGFVGGLAADVLTGGAAAAIGINPFTGMMAGAAIGSSIQGGMEAQAQAATGEASVGSGPSSTSGIGTSGSQTTTINGQQVETQYALAEQRVQQEKAATASFLAGGQAQIGGMQVAEAGTESAIRAAAASRGFKIGSGTPGVALRGQQEKGAAEIGLARQQLSSNVAERTAATESGYQSFRAAAAMKDYGLVTQANNAWISAFGNIAGEGQTMLKNWNPSILSQNSFSGANVNNLWQSDYGWQGGGF